ncbi:MAG: hypothetical protein IKD08_06235 [Alphaproteobacteria bacterium]|nr:hypothetical protein [Alphaproteobacteria bacterium]
MMKAKHIYFCALGLIFIVALVLVAHRQYVVNSGTTILVPLGSGKNAKTIDSDYVYLRYKNLIPQKQLEAEQGKIIVYVNSFGVASFVKVYHSGDELKYGEHILDYHIYRPFGLTPAKPRVYFASYRYRYTDKDNQYNYRNARYAVLKVNDDGFALLSGLADANYNLINKDFRF